MTTHTHHVKTLMRNIGGAKIRGDAFPHLLLAGPAGVGKTHLALSCGLAYGTRVITLKANRSTTPAAFSEELMPVLANDVIFIDEAHALRSDIQETLFSLIDFDSIPKSQEGKDGRKSYVVGSRIVPKLGLILATNQPGFLLPALMTRLRSIYLPHLSVEELIEIGREYATELNINISPQALRMVAALSNGIPRTFKMTMQELAQANTASLGTQLGTDHVRDLLDDRGVDHVGLTLMERRYLELLRPSYVSPVNIRVITASLGLDQRYIMNQLEPPFLKAGYISISASGRKLEYPGRSLLDKKKEVILTAEEEAALKAEESKYRII